MAIQARDARSRNAVALSADAAVDFLPYTLAEGQAAHIEYEVVVSLAAVADTGRYSLWAVVKRAVGGAAVIEEQGAEDDRGSATLAAKTIVVTGNIAKLQLTREGGVTSYVSVFRTVKILTLP